jgi:DNA polymerase-3 subunit gamma/tau
MTNFYDKHRPQSLDDIVFSELQTEFMLKSIASRDRHCDHLLLHGTNGSGKTSCAEIIAKALTNNGGLLLRESYDDFFKHKELADYVNRNNFFYKSQSDDRSVIIFNELDKNTKLHNLWMLMDEARSDLFVIATTNNPLQIDAAVRSRCEKHEFKRITPLQFAPRALKIFEAENVDLDLQTVHQYLLQHSNAVSDVRDYMRTVEMLVLLAKQNRLPPLDAVVKTPRLAVVV